MADEPILHDEDRQAWTLLDHAARVHARSPAHRRKVEAARETVTRCIDATPDAAVGWSAGKDSTALVHLACVEMGHALPVYSEKDDLDFPGERDYIERLAALWGLDLTIVSPDVSLQQWIADHAGELDAGEDFHGRAAALSREHFYGLIESYTGKHGAVLLGLRQEESRGRKMNRALRGKLYQKRTGQWICTPLADWSGLDVFAYLLSRDVPVLDVYRCIGFMHRSEPWRVRKSWWIPGAHSRKGGMVWLRRYYPSLYRRLCRMLPDARRHA